MKLTEYLNIGATQILILGYVAYCNTEYFDPLFNKIIMFMAIGVSLIIFIVTNVMEWKEGKKKDDISDSV